MTDINNLVLVGRITKDVSSNDFSYTQSGLAKLETSIAVNRSRKKGDKWEDEVSFFNITLWGKTAENLRQHISKGQQVVVQGSLQQQRWKDQNGNNRSQLSIVTENFQLIGGKKQNEPQEQQAEGYTDEYQEDIPF